MLWRTVDPLIPPVCGIEVPILEWRKRLKRGGVRNNAGWKGGEPFTRRLKLRWNFYGPLSPFPGGAYNMSGQAVALVVGKGRGGLMKWLCLPVAQLFCSANNRANRAGKRPDEAILLAVEAILFAASGRGPVQAQVNDS